MSWKDIPRHLQNGVLTGYIVRYKPYKESEFQHKIVPYGFTMCTLDNLRPYTYYWIDICAFNSGGEGPVDYVIVQTLEGGMLTKFIIL